MDNSRFKQIRTRLAKTQKELAKLLAVSIKAVHSYEQGWRKIPHHVERQLYFLLSRTVQHKPDPVPPCWDRLNCPEEKLKTCPAWEFQSGDLCWFINGTRCNGQEYTTWPDKMAACENCPVFQSILNPEKEAPHDPDPA